MSSLWAVYPDAFSYVLYTMIMIFQLTYELPSVTNSSESHGSTKPPGYDSHAEAGQCNHRSQ